MTSPTPPPWPPQPNVRPVDPDAEAARLAAQRATPPGSGGVIAEIDELTRRIWAQCGDGDLAVDDVRQVLTHVRAVYGLEAL